MSVLAVIFICYLLSTLGYITYLFIKQDRWRRIAFGLLGAGFVVHTALLTGTFLDAGHIPARNLHETLVIAGWALVSVFLVYQVLFQLNIVGTLAAPLAAGIILVAIIAPREMPSLPDMEALYSSGWLVLHIMAVFWGEAAFAMACATGLLYLLQERAIKQKKHGFIFRRLPPLEVLDRTGYNCIMAGFFLLSLGLVAGFIYAKSFWGHFISWDPKEVWSLITWVLYAGLIHARLVAGWRGRRSAIMAIAGFACVLFTFLGVNFLMEGHHGAFTQWQPDP